MKLLEYEAKALLQKAGLNVADGRIINVGDQLPSMPAFPVVVKSQVPVGGRGKLGGVTLVNSEKELTAAVKNISALSIKGYAPKTLLIEQALAIDREFYLSLVINRGNAAIDIVAHPDGGMEVESQKGFFVTPITGSNADTVGESLAELFGLEGKAFLLAEWAQKLYECFTKNDTTLLEINPLILTKQGELVAGDCKMTLDDAAAFRHPDWQFETPPADNSYVVLNKNGTVATIANGAGLAMATVDAVGNAGFTPANFLDIGGSATLATMRDSFEKISQLPNVTAIVINIFGGIFRCDIAAEAIIAAKQELPNLPELYIRLSGNRAEQAIALLKTHGMQPFADLKSCLKAIKS